MKEFNPLRTAEGTFGDEFRDGVVMLDNPVVTDQIVGMGDDLLLQGA